MTYIAFDSFLFIAFFMYLLLGQLVLGRFLNELRRSSSIPEKIKCQFKGLTPIGTGSIHAELTLLKMIYLGEFSQFNDKHIVNYGRLMQVICYGGALLAVICLITMLTYF